MSDPARRDGAPAETEERPPDQGAAAGSAASSRTGPVCRACVPWLVRRRRGVLAAALVLFAAGSFFSARLYANLRSDFEELLPRNAPSAVAARTIRGTLHNVTHLAVVLEGADPGALQRLANDLAARLRKLPPGLVDTVEYRTDELEAFLRRFGGFYLSTADLDTVQRRIDARIAWQKRKANPFLNVLGDEADPGPPPSLDFQDVVDRYLPFQTTQFRAGYYQTPDGRLLVLLVRPPEAATGMAANQRVLHAVKRELSALKPASYHPSIRTGFDGEVATLIEEQSALVSDLLVSTVVVVVLVLAALWAYFRRWTAILSILGALGVGCALTFGAAWFWVGYLNANTAFLGSIVVGNGINVSIIVVARFLEERRRGRAFDEALQVAWSGTAPATMVASFAAGLAYLSLAATDFRGFSQFGVIGGMGMALCWVTAYLLLPPLLSALEGRSGSASPRGHRPLVGALASRLDVRHGRAVRMASGVLVVAAAAGLATYRGSLFEHDFSKLRTSRTGVDSSQYWGAKVDQVFKVFLTPVVIRADTPADLKRVVAELERERAALGAADPLREVRTLDSVIPPDQAEKLPRLTRLRDTLTDARLAHLDPKTRRRALDFRPPPDLRPITLADLPASIRLPLVERDGTAGRIALAFPRKMGWTTQRESNELAGIVRGAIERSGVPALAVGQWLLFIDMVEAIIRDGPMATLLAFGAVVALVALLLRRPRPTVQVVGSLLLGVAWLVGLAAWARVKLNFLNFVVLPITFGIGVDYSVNIVQRWHREGPGSLDRVLRETGGAVALCSLTTIIGYASLVTAESRALRGFGTLASLGELACVAAAVVAMPAFLVGTGRSAAPRRPPAS